MVSIAERDWKVFREMHRVALERFCERTLDEVERLRSDSAKTNHERYLAIFNFLQRQDKEMALTFDGMRRSTALVQLARIQSHKLLTDEEMSRFSPETLNPVRLYLGLAER